MSTPSSSPRGNAHADVRNRAERGNRRRLRRPSGPIMATAESKTPPIHAPLSTDEQNALDRVLQGLHSALRSLLAVMPVEAQTASGLARYLDTERTTCQRAVSAVNKPFAGLALVGEIPGVEGLRLLTEAIRTDSRFDAEQRSAAAQLAEIVADYDATTRRLAGNRSRLLKRIALADAHDPAVQDDSWFLQQRQALSDAATALTGRHSQLWLATHFFETDPDCPERLVETRAHGLLGHVARPDAVPLSFHVFKTDDEEADFAPLVPGEADLPAGLLPEFSSQPLPLVRARQPDRFLLQNVETSGGAHGSMAPADVMFAMAGHEAHPAHTPSKLSEVWAMVNFPVRRMLLDVFLHRDLARQCIPDLDLHLWGPDFASNVGGRWQTRMTHPLQLQHLGVGFNRAGIDAWDRYPELIGSLSARRGFDPDRFVGYRCDVQVPVWRAGYRMTFDFGN
ncbi:MAG: hypothetical protein AAGD32_01520 [Planctomycetota bacterium]